MSPVGSPYLHIVLRNCSQASRRPVSLIRQSSPFTLSKRCDSSAILFICAEQGIIIPLGSSLCTYFGTSLGAYFAFLSIFLTTCSFPFSFLSFSSTAFLSTLTIALLLPSFLSATLASLTSFFSLPFATSFGGSLLSFLSFLPPFFYSFLGSGDLLSFVVFSIDPLASFFGQSFAFAFLSTTKLVRVGTFFLLGFWLLFFDFLLGRHPISYVFYYTKHMINFDSSQLPTRQPPPKLIVSEPTIPPYIYRTLEL